MDYSRQVICDLVYNYQKLHDFRLSSGNDGATYCSIGPFIANYSGSVGPQSLKKKPHHERSPFETSAVMKADLEIAIEALSWREKFILLATVYESEAGVDYFGDWCGSTPKQMKELKHEVLNKMEHLMNPGLERRGGSHGGGRPRKTKN